MSGLVENRNPRNTRKQQRERWIQMANQAEKQKSNKRLARMLFQFEAIKIIKNLMESGHYFTALKYINHKIPEFKNQYPDTYKWLKNAENKNLNENNMENLTKININKFQTSKGNALENVNVYEAFATKRGGKTYCKKKSYHKTYKRHN